MNLYGCHNKKRNPGFYVQVRSEFSVDGNTHKWRYIENSMSTDCRYDKSSDDPRCAGCKK